MAPPKHLNGRESKTATWFFGGIFLLVVIVITTMSIIDDVKFQESSYNYTIDSIKLVSGNRGHPWIKIGNSWRLLKIQEMTIANVVESGDSLVKKSGSMKITVHRKDAEGKMTVVDLENK